MIRSLWTAATGMQAQQVEQDVVANNLANVNTVGFKKSRADFQDLMYQLSTKAGSETSSGNQLTVGIEIGMGVKPVATQKIFSQGDYQQTGNSFDWAIEGDGFFQLDDNGTTVYTRAGNFKVNRDGVLCNTDGLQLIPEVSIPQDAVTFTLDSGGTWTAADENGNTLATGRIELAKFINPAGLSSIGRNLFEKTEGSGEPLTGNPGEDGLGTTSQRFLEMSNVNVIDEMVKMIVGQRAYEINSKSIVTADNMLSMINNLKK
ncbi:flagellar basal-body rod protein FlgG [Syntrophus aciditrophicus]|uniref:Flagellar basal-body rod protein FlgG n=1 Tax=Syntrophus aciditrophicus (strain SB) TaxID=56780 RepID=Q2LT23_SYNAS|nr:flagellar basal-body rod protein FlgG [Syntrophus aciditrophicus]ABC77230.1 flagellar basal-body rod protein [Syntrophus aciditrophicus SB]OPY13993.1 MAG: Flagellar basal-body rod protein FlgG [Syntrophus sp. PtaB.Bin075]